MANFPRTSLISKGEAAERLRAAGIDINEFQEQLQKTGADVAVDAPPEIGSAVATSTSLLEAAVRGAFLPADLGFSPDATVLSSSDLGALLASSEVVPAQGKQMWQLKAPIRKQVLLQAKASNSLDTAAEIASNPADPEGTLLRKVLKGDVPDQDKLATSELQTLATVSDWLAGTDLAATPQGGDIRREIAKRELLDPFRLLVGRTLENGADGKNDRIVGRDKQMEALRSYVGMIPPSQLQDYVKRSLRSLWQQVTSSDTANEPLVVEGIGGIGKSSLIAKFILDHALFPGVDLPFAYLDFDRAALAPREPMQLLIDITLQFGIWFPPIESQLSSLRIDLRKVIDQLAANPTARSLEDRTRSSLSACCFSLKTIVESINQGRAPVLIVFDTFEVVQYDEAAVAGVASLISALRTPKPANQESATEPWMNLRIVVAGRGEPDVQSSQPPIQLGPLPLTATEQLIRRRNDADEIGLNKTQISALARPLRSSPLDVTIVMNWLKGRDPAERGRLVDEIIEEVTADDQAGGPLGDLRITGILVNRMINHLNDRAVQRLANPGLVVRVITPDIIRNVMAPASGLVSSPGDLPPAAETELFNRLRREQWLVTSAGDGVVRHRPEVRLAMLDLMRRNDPDAFDSANRAAIDYFRDRADSSDEARAEAIYHLLLGGDLNIDAAERLWTPAVGPLLANAVDDLKGLAQIYLKARLGRSVGLAALQTLPSSVQLAVLLQFGKRFLQRGLFGGLADVLNDLQAAENNPALVGLQWETLYRSGRWRNLRDAAQAQLATGALKDTISALRASNFDVARGVDEKMGWPFRFALRAATRDPQMASQILATGIVSPTLELGRASKLNEAFWDFSTFVVNAASNQPNSPAQELADRLVETISILCAQDRKMPAAATTSGALRVLVFHEKDSARNILRAFDFDGAFSTFSGRELQGLQEAFAATVDDPRGGSGSGDPRTASLLGPVETFLKQAADYPVASVIADPTLTRQFAASIRAIAQSGSQRGALAILRVLTMTYPDWLEPLGHSLTRAFSGKVPSQGTWLSSLEHYFVGGKPRWRGRDLTDGHEILALADEAASLPEAVKTYRALVDPRNTVSADFIEIAEAFDRWQAMLESAIRLGTPPLALA